MFEWQRILQDSREFFHSGLLDFLDLLVAQAPENNICGTDRGGQPASPKKELLTNPSYYIWLVNEVNIPYIPAESSGR